MTFLPSLPQTAKLVDVLASYPALSRPLIEMHEVLLRGPSELSIAERELLAAFVSGLNECRYCHGVHEKTAQRFGIDPSLLTGLLEDPSQVKIDNRLRPVLNYVKKLTLQPHQVRRSDVETVQQAGWSDLAIRDMATIVALFNFMNRLVLGLGIEADDEYFEFSSARLHDKGYSGLLELLPEE